jgi:hypothetical protein
MQAKTVAVLADRLGGVNHAGRGTWENTCLYALIQLDWIEFLGRLSRPLPPAQAGGLRLLIRLAKTSQLGRWRRDAAAGLWRGAAVLLVHDDPALLGGGLLRGAACAVLWSGWVAPRVVLDIFGALSLAWTDLVVLNDPPS